MRIIELSKINGRSVSLEEELSSPSSQSSSFTDTDDVGENQNQAAPAAAAAPASITQPVVIQVESIRCFYARRADRGVGTRITFTDGGGFAVSETFDEVKAKVEAALAA